MAKLAVSIDNSTKTNTYDGIKMRFTLIITGVEKSGENLKIYYKVKSERLEGSSYPVATLSAYINGSKIKTWSNNSFNPVGFPSKPGTSDEYSTTIPGGWGNDFTYQVKGEIGGCKTMNGTEKECMTSMIKYYDYNGNLLGNSGWCYPTTSIALRSLSATEGDYWLYDNKQYSPGASFKFPYKNANYDVYDFRAGWDKLIFTQCNISNVTETSFSYSDLLVNTPTNVDKYYYKINSGNWIEIASSANTIGGLSPSIAYTIHFKATFKNDPDGESKAAFADIPITTYAFPSMSSYRLPTDYTNNGSFVINNPLQRKIRIKVDAFKEDPRKATSTVEIYEWLNLIYEGTNSQNISNIITSSQVENMGFEKESWFAQTPEHEDFWTNPRLKYTVSYTVDSQNWVNILGGANDTTVYQAYNWPKAYPILINQNKISGFITYALTDLASGPSAYTADTSHFIPGKTRTLQVKLNSSSNPFSCQTITHTGHEPYTPQIQIYDFYIDNDITRKKVITSLNSYYSISNIINITAKSQYTIKIVAHNTAGVDAQFETNMPNVVQYTTPHINLNAIERTSTGVNITTNGSWVGINGISGSPATLILKYKEDPNGSWENYNGLSASSLNLNKQAIPLNLTFDQAYKFKMTVTDKYGATDTTSELSLAAGTPILFVDSIQNGVGINCFPTGTGLHAKSVNVINSGGIGRNTITGSTSTNSVIYTNRLPAKGGTFAMTSDLPTVTSGTGSPTWDKGNSDCTVTYIKYGKIIFYDFNFQLEGQTDSGKNVYEGYWYDFTPAMASNSVGYYGARAIVCTWGSDNKITARNAGATSFTSDTNEIHCRGVAYLQ